MYGFFLAAALTACWVVSPVLILHSYLQLKIAKSDKCTILTGSVRLRLVKDIICIE